MSCGGVWGGWDWGFWERRQSRGGGECESGGEKYIWPRTDGGDGHAWTRLGGGRGTGAGAVGADVADLAALVALWCELWLPS